MDTTFSDFAPASNVPPPSELWTDDPPGCTFYVCADALKVHDLFSDDPPPPPEPPPFSPPVVIGRTLKEIVRDVARRRGLDPEAVRDIGRRSRPYTLARQEVFWIARQIRKPNGGWRYSLNMIGRHFPNPAHKEGFLDHGSVHWGAQRHAQRLRAAIIQNLREANEASAREHSL